MNLYEVEYSNSSVVSVVSFIRGVKVVLIGLALNIFTKKILVVLCLVKKNSTISSVRYSYLKKEIEIKIFWIKVSIILKELPVIKILSA